MVKPLKVLTISAVAAAALSVTALAADEGAGTVTAEDCLNFRQEANMSAEIQGTADNGEQVLVLEKVDDDWFQVYYNNTVGYMASDFLQVEESGEAEFGKAVIGEGGADVYPATEEDSEAEFTLEAETAINISAVSGDWYYISTDDAEGYIRSEDIDFTLEMPGTAGDEIIAQALGFLDVPYVYGGTTPSGFDCSGLIYYIFNNSGYSVNRTAADQMNNGEEVTELAAGDLVFFANGGGGSVGHVGIYMSDNQFIHACSGSGKVMISSLDESYYASYYCGARRVAQG